MEHITMNIKGQITIPVAIRKELGLKENTSFVVDKLMNGDLVLKKKKSVLEAFADFPRPKNGIKASVKEMNEAIKQAAAQRYLKSRKD